MTALTLTASGVIVGALTLGCVLAAILLRGDRG